MIYAMAKIGMGDDVEIDEAMYYLEQERQAVEKLKESRRV